MINYLRIKSINYFDSLVEANIPLNFKYLYTIMHTDTPFYVLIHAYEKTKKKHSHISTGTTNY